MENLRRQISRFTDSESGATFLEYTVLLGILLAMTISVLLAVGDWASGQWVTLDSLLAGGGSADSGKVCCTNATGGSNGNCCN